MLSLFVPAVVAQQTDDPHDRFDNLKAFAAKGNWMAGGTMSLQLTNTDQKSQLIRYVREDKYNNFSVKLDGAYAFHDDNFAGLGILYGRSERSGTYENSDGEIYSENYFGKRMSFTPFLKNLTPIDKNGRFNIVTQIEFWNQIEQGITQTELNEVITRKLVTSYTGLLGIRPGISVFVIKNVAFETTLNVAGIRYSFEKSEVTDQPAASTETMNIDFKLDLLQLNIGIFIYLMPKKAK